MKTVTLILFICFVLLQNSYSQNNNHIVNAGDDISNVIPVNHKFHYPQFMAGNVVFRDGNAAAAQLNYNILAGQMQFISPQGDTLSIANEETIKYITIDNDSFFYDRCYLQLITGNTSAKLAKNETIKLSDIKKIGAFGQPTSASGITTLSSLHTGNQSTSLTENRKLMLRKQTVYYIGDSYNHFLPATKKNLMKMFGKKHNEVETFLEQNNISFDKEEDLEKLVSFLKETS